MKTTFSTCSPGTMVADSLASRRLREKVVRILGMRICGDQGPSREYA